MRNSADMLNWASFWRQLGGNFHTVGVARWPSTGDTRGYRLCRPKLTPVNLISMIVTKAFTTSRARYSQKKEKILENLFLATRVMLDTWLLKKCGTLAKTATILMTVKSLNVGRFL